MLKFRNCNENIELKYVKLNETNAKGITVITLTSKVTKTPSGSLWKLRAL